MPAPRAVRRLATALLVVVAALAVAAPAAADVEGGYAFGLCGALGPDAEELAAEEAADLVSADAGGQVMTAFGLLLPVGAVAAAPRRPGPTTARRAAAWRLPGLLWAADLAEPPRAQG